MGGEGGEEGLESRFIPLLAVEAMQNVLISPRSRSEAALLSSLKSMQLWNWERSRLDCLLRSLPLRGCCREVRLRSSPESRSLELESESSELRALIEGGEAWENWALVKDLAGPVGVFFFKYRLR